MTDRDLLQHQLGKSQIIISPRPSWSALPGPLRTHPSNLTAPIRRPVLAPLPQSSLRTLPVASRLATPMCTPSSVAHAQFPSATVLSPLNFKTHGTIPINRYQLQRRALSPRIDENRGRRPPAGGKREGGRGYIPRTLQTFAKLCKTLQNFAKLCKLL